MSFDSMRKNRSGLNDPTAFQAIINIEREQKKKELEYKNQLKNRDKNKK
jgi:hypothetical protein